MYIKCITRIILSIIIYVTKNWGWLEFSKFSQHNGKLPLPRWKHGNCLVITIYDINSSTPSIFVHVCMSIGNTNIGL